MSEEIKDNFVRHQVKQKLSYSR